MYIKLFSICMLFCQLVQFTHATNHKLLEMESDTIQTQLWSKKIFEKKDIEERLIFVNDPSKVDDKYKNHLFIQNFYSKLTEDLKTNSFLSFQNSCIAIISKKDSSEISKISANILFERVLNKYSKDMILLSRLRKLKAIEMNQENEPFDSNLFETFMNADRNIK